jgi:hypothetical protein
MGLTLQQASIPIRIGMDIVIVGWGRRGEKRVIGHQSSVE